MRTLDFGHHGILIYEMKKEEGKGEALPKAQRTQGSSSA